MVNKKRGKQNRKKGMNFLYIQLKLIDGVKYVYCIKHAYKFLLREQEEFAAVLWRLRQGVSCQILYVKA